MIAFFPQSYPDELLYSRISRYHQRTGNARFVFTAEEVYKNGKVTHPSVDFVNAYTNDAMEWIAKEETWETVAEKHTMYPAFIRFLPLKKREEAVDGVINCNGNWKKLMCLPILNEKRFLRYCPKCVEEDRAAFGETYWHREHQLPRTRICAKHTCFLENSEVATFSKSSPGLFDAESIVPYIFKSDLCENKTEIEFTRYVTEVFRQPIDLQHNFSIGSFLHSKLQSTYKNKSGLLRNISSLYEDYIAFYGGIPTMTQSYMQKIFNGHIFDAYFILQLAFFESVPAYDVAHIPSHSFKKEYEELFKAISAKHSIDYETVSTIGAEILKHTQSKAARISGPRMKEYERLDQELLPKVKSLVDGILKKNGKPEKVSVTKIQRTLGLPQKCFNKLPKCRAYIEKHAETQEEFWTRKVQWAIDEIEKAGGTVTLSQIMKRTNMRRKEIERTWSDDQIRNGAI